VPAEPHKKALFMTHSTPNNTRRRRRGPKTPEGTVLVAGQRVKLADLPVIQFIKTCGHPGKDFAVIVGDLVFCDTCRDHSYVATLTP
jgi:hypothetical protein